KEDDSEQQMSHEYDDDMEYDPFDVKFTEWLALNFFNYKIMDHYTMKALWIYWARGDDEVELTDEESSDSDNEDEVAMIFRIETNVFDFKIPLCRAFKEFNYLLQIDPDVLTKDIDGFKTYEEYKDDWIYGWNKALKDGNLKEEALKNKAIMDGMIKEDDESKSENEMEHEEEERCYVFDDHERPVCNIRRFEMIKCSFRDDEEYVAIKENKYDDLTNTSKEAIHTYQEFFRMMDEGWMVTRGHKSVHEME
ncbi:hypothetical protein Tco_1231724, partial [Tanacetum coccineum]